MLVLSVACTRLSAVSHDFARMISLFRLHTHRTAFFLGLGLRAGVVREHSLTFFFYYSVFLAVLFLHDGLFRLCPLLWGKA